MKNGGERKKRGTEKTDFRDRYRKGNTFPQFFFSSFFLSGSRFTKPFLFSTTLLKGFIQEKTSSKDFPFQGILETTHFLKFQKKNLRVYFSISNDTTVSLNKVFAPSFNGHKFCSAAVYFFLTSIFLKLRRS